MKVRNEKQQQAYDMLQKIPQVVLVEKEVPETGRWYDKLALCIINGDLFVRISDFDLYAVGVMRKHLDADEIYMGEMIPVRNTGQRYGGAAIWVATAGMIKHYEKELAKLDSKCQKKIDFAFTYFDNFDVSDLNRYTLDEKQLSDAHYYYRERIRLLNENQEDTAKKIRESRKPFEPIQSTDAPAIPTATAADGLTLEQLVDRIEAMGWTVTLHRKEGQPADAEGQTPADIQPPAEAYIKVPTWYNDDLYQMFGRPLLSFNLSFGTVSALEHVGITTLGQVVGMTRLDLLGIKHFGKKKLTEMDDMFEELGLEFGQNLDRWHEARKAYLAVHGK